MLDRTLPCEQVFGIPGIAWSQGGRLFSPAGVEVSYRRATSGDDSEHFVVTKVESAPQPIESPVSDERIRPFADMHWKQLKALVEMYGGTWTTKEEALQFLRSHG